MSFSYSLNSDDFGEDLEVDGYLDDDDGYTNPDYGYDDEVVDPDEFGSFEIKSHVDNDFEFFKTEEDDGKPRILLMGLRRSGKSSIRKVVFQKMSPHETLFLEATTKLEKNDISENSFIKFQIWDFPGQVNFFDSAFEPEMIFGGCGALVYVIDAQDSTSDSVSKLFQTIQQAYQVNKKITFEVFIHKVDNISEEMKLDIVHDVQQRINEDLQTDEELKNIQIRYHKTSIYDHSIFDAFSKVIQKLLPILPTLESLMDVLVNNSKIEKAFLFDVVSKIYIASDTQPCDQQVYELCSDVIDIVLDVCDIYGKKKDEDKRKKSFNYDESTHSVIHLDNSSILYLRHVNKYLALVCLLQKEAFSKMGLIDYNFKCFKKGIAEIFKVDYKTL